MNAPQMPEDRPQIRDLAHFALFAASPNGGERRARLVWGERAGNPRVTVFTGDPGDKIQGGVIAAPMDPITFMVFLDLLEATAKGPETIPLSIDCFTSKRDGAGRPGEKVLLSKLFYGKDNQGIVWISVQAENRPKVKFTFSISDYHQIYGPDKQPINASKASEIAAIATINALRRAYTQFVGALRQPAPPRTGGRNDSQQSRPVAASPASSAPADFDDITF